MTQHCIPPLHGYIRTKSPPSVRGTHFPCASPSHITLKSTYFYLSLNQHLPPSNTHTITAAHFEWSGKLFGSLPPPQPSHLGVTASSLSLNTPGSSKFRYPTATDTLIEARGFGLRPVSGIPLFCSPLPWPWPQTSNPRVLPRILHLRSLLQFNDGHPLPPLPPLPTCLSMRTLPPQHFCQPTPNNCTNWASIIYTPRNVSTTPHLSPKIGSPRIALKLSQTSPSKSWAPSWDSSALDEFASEIVEPLANRHDTTHVYNYFPRTLSAQEVDWTIFVPRHRTVV